MIEIEFSGSITHFSAGTITQEELDSLKNEIDTYEDEDEFYGVESIVEIGSYSDLESFMGFNMNGSDIIIKRDGEIVTETATRQIKVIRDESELIGINENIRNQIKSNIFKPSSYWEKREEISKEGNHVFEGTEEYAGYRTYYSKEIDEEFDLNNLLFTTLHLDLPSETINIIHNVLYLTKDNKLIRFEEDEFFDLERDDIGGSIDGEEFFEYFESDEDF
ncbi:MAG: hypothetical protein K9K80_01350 [Spirochaetia bacterium]|nr:hypothetical protein [Spirochaetia bacterium]